MLPARGVTPLLTDPVALQLPLDLSVSPARLWAQLVSQHRVLCWALGG